MVATGRHKRRLNDPNLRDRLYELLEHEHLSHAASSRFAQLIVLVITLDVMAVVLASVPDYDAEFGLAFVHDDQPVDR